MKVHTDLFKDEKHYLRYHPLLVMQKLFESWSKKLNSVIATLLNRLV